MFTGSKFSPLEYLPRTDKHTWKCEKIVYLLSHWLTHSLSLPLSLSLSLSLSHTHTHTLPLIVIVNHQLIMLFCSWSNILECQQGVGSVVLCVSLYAWTIFAVQGAVVKFLFWGRANLNTAAVATIILVSVPPVMTTAYSCPLVVPSLLTNQAAMILLLWFISSLLLQYGCLTTCRKAGRQKGWLLKACMKMMDCLTSDSIHSSTRCGWQALALALPIEKHGWYSIPY